MELWHYFGDNVNLDISNTLLSTISSLDIMYISIIGIIVGFILGLKINEKLKLLHWLVLGLFVAFLLGSTPYYQEIPFSHIFLAGIVGVLVGNICKSNLKAIK
ncbi:hypothetical protein [Methanococcus voltae]|uniref:Uncharacterized protein n=1 Tax=Methanococcus voltae (strain ATCC BAA-1334 / A3) TaxID=456320 RepID=D7DUU2_METV3|nr:hypothetical protein [Methanococcus voltae]MCS3900704.1 putative membrane protein YqgA involved in biofilm formation [Methanococcus voltae]